MEGVGRWVCDFPLGMVAKVFLAPTKTKYMSHQCDRCQLPVLPQRRALVKSNPTSMRQEGCMFLGSPPAWCIWWTCNVHPSCSLTDKVANATAKNALFARAGNTSLVCVQSARFGIRTHSLRPIIVEEQNRCEFAEGCT